jgi:hypothetical protein
VNPQVLHHLTNRWTHHPKANQHVHSTVLTVMDFHYIASYVPIPVLQTLELGNVRASDTVTKPKANHARLIQASR